MYRDEEKKDDDTSVTDATGNTQQSQLLGPDALARMKADTRVVRGKDWKWGDQVCISFVINILRKVSSLAHSLSLSFTHSLLSHSFS